MPNYESQPRAKTAFDFIHIDLSSGRSILPNANTDMLIFDKDIPPIVKGSRYFIIITDDYTRYR
jgi:hypothetical protein